MSYKYKQRLEWTKYCKYRIESQYKIYKKLHDDVYDEYQKLFTKNKFTKTYTTNKLTEKRIYEEHIGYSDGFLKGLNFVKSIFDNILSMSKSELGMFKQNALLDLYYMKQINKEWHKDEFYKELKSETLLEINEHIIMEKKEAIERANKRFQENLDLNNKKEDKAIVLNLTQEDINNAKNNGEKNGTKQKRNSLAK